MPIRTEDKERGSHRAATKLLAAVMVVILLITAGVYRQQTAQGMAAAKGLGAATTQPTRASEDAAAPPDQQMRFVFARQLAAEAEIAIQSGEADSLSRGALLAIESFRQYHTVEGDTAMRHALSLMPRPAFQLSQKRNYSIKQIAFDPHSRWIAASLSHTQSVTVWSLSTGKEIAHLAHQKLAYNDGISSLASDPTGSLIATTASDGTARLWKTDTWQEVARLQHDADKVYGATFSSDGSLLATQSNNTVYIWNVSTGKEVARLEHENSVRSIAFSPYGKWLAAAENEGSSVWIWNAETGEKITQLRHNSIVGTMTFSPYGKWLATASGSTAQVWEITTGRLVTRVMHRDVVNDLAFNPDSTLLATGSKDNTACIWEIAAGREVQQMTHKNEVSTVEFSPDSVSLATGSDNSLSGSLAQIWNVASGQETIRIEHPQEVDYASFSPDGSKLATKYWYSSKITVWDLSPDAPPEVLRFEDENTVEVVVFSADGSKLVSGNADGSLQVWDTAVWKEITPAPMKHEDKISALDLNADGSLLASADTGGVVSVWNPASGKEIMRMRHIAKYGGWISDVTFSPNGKLLATSGSDHTARLWNLATELEIARTTHSGGAGYPVWETAFSADGKYFASAGGGEVRILQAPDWREIALLKHSKANSIAFNPDGTLLASSGGDDRARVWDTASWTEIVRMKHNDRDEVVSAVAFSPDGQTLATASQHAMTRLWDTNTWDEIGRLPVGADSLIFSPDGKQLFTRNYADTAQIWNVPSGGEEIARFEFPQNTQDMALSPNGQILAVTSGWYDKGGQLTATMWQPNDLISEACFRLGRNFTLSEWQQHIGDRPYAETCPGLPVPLSSFWDTIDIIEQNLCLDAPDIAAARYKVAVSLALQANSDTHDDNVYKTCRYGTREGFAEMVLPACDRAVELMRDKTFALNVRGVARALVGDYQDALEDLNVVVEDWENSPWYSDVAAQRKQLIEAIEKGQDVSPYTTGCNEFTAVVSTPNAKTPTPTPASTFTSAVAPTAPPKSALHPTEVTHSFAASVERVVAGEPGQTVSHTLTVTNTGSITGSYDIWAKTTTYREFILPYMGYGSDSFDYRDEVGTIGSGKSVQMPINVRIPNYATNNQFEQVSLLVYDEDGYAPTVSMQMITAVSYTTAIERVGHIGVNVRDVVIQSDYAYLAAGMEGLLILDVSDALEPVEVGVYKNAEGALGQVESVQVVDDYAYLITNLSGLGIVDVSDPAAPLKTGAYNPGGRIKRVRLAGNYAYIVWEFCLYRCADRLRIVDISNPASPVEVSVYGMSFEGNYYDTGDRIYDVAVMDNYAYLFMPDEMRVLDISNPAHPLEIKSYPMTGAFVSTQGDYAYLHSSDKQVQVIDISNPELVVAVGTYNVPHSIFNLSSTGNHLYVTTEKDDVYILDLSVPAAPALVSIYSATGNRQVGGAAAKENYLYLAAGAAGLQIVDVSNPASPEKAGVYGAPSAVMGVALDKNYIYAADRYNGLRILKRAAGESLVEIGAYNQPALDVAVDNEGYAYVISGDCKKIRYSWECYGDLLILNVSNPAAPIRVGLYEGEWRKVEAVNGRVFVVGRTASDDDKAFHVLNISNRTSPQQIATYDAADFALADGYLYLLSNKEERLTILDAATLEEVGVYDMSEHDPYLFFAREIAVSGDYAYILENVSYTTGSGASWLVLNISNPAAPVEVDVAFNYRAKHESGGSPVAFTYGGHTFLAAKSSGLRVLDITDVAAPTEVDSFGAPNRVTDAALARTRDIYLASDANGLYVLRYVGGSEESTPKLDN